MINYSLFNTDTRNQFEVFRLSEKGFSLEQINRIFELDKYFSNHEIGKNGDLIKYILENDNISFNNDLNRNIKVVLKHQNNPVFNRVAERLRCTSVEDYYKYILSVRELESFCDTYTSSPRDVKSLEYKRDEEGHVLLEPKDYLITNIPASKGSRAGRWYLLSNRLRVFIKNICSEREAYSELVAEEIAKQMGIPAASYDLVQMGGLVKIASINVLRTGEELIHGSDILQVQSIKDINSICNTIHSKIRRNFPGVSDSQTQAIKEDFLKITIFDKIIGNWDRNPDNWGFIKSPDGELRLCPEFDNNRSLNWKEFDYDKDMHLNGDHDIKTLLEYCLNNFSKPDEFVTFVENCVQNVNVKKACANILDEKGISIPQKEVSDMELLVHGRGTQFMRRWLEEKRKNIPTEEHQK